MINQAVIEFIAKNDIDFHLNQINIDNVGNFSGNFSTKLSLIHQNYFCLYFLQFKKPQPQLQRINKCQFSTSK